MNAWGSLDWAQIWQIFLLFAVPFGTGMPAGVLLAKDSGIGWIPMLLLYFTSDVLLACLLEPIMMGFVYLSQSRPNLALFIQRMKDATDLIIARYGEKPSVLMLIGISLGFDPMTGRAAALAAGHHFISGWAIAIAGDMLFFCMIAVSVIYLKGVLGNGFLAALIVMLGMFLIPQLVRYFRRKKAGK